METNEDFTQMVGGMVLTQKTVFNIPEGELRSYYLKTAFLTCPNYCTPQRTEQQILNHLFDEQKKVLSVLTYLMRTPWADGIPALHEISSPYLLQSQVSVKERKKVSDGVAEHVRFLARLMGDRDTLKQLYALYILHHNNLGRLQKKKTGE